MKKRLRRFRGFVGPSPSAIASTAKRRRLYMHSAARRKMIDATRDAITSRMLDWDSVGVSHR